MSSFYFTSLTAIFLTTIIAFFVLFKGVKSRINQVFFFFLLTLSVGIFGDVFYYSHLINIFDPKDILRCVYLVTPFSGSTLIHFILLFTQTRAHSFVIYFCYGVSVILSVCNALVPMFFFQSVVLNSQRELSMVVNFGFHIFVVSIIAAVLGSFVLVIRCLLKSKGRLKEQMKYYIFASVSIIVAAVVYSVSMSVSPNIPRLDNLFLVLYMGIIAYSITKSELFQIQLVISRVFSCGLTYSIAAFVFVLGNSFIDSYNLKAVFNFILVLICINYGAKLRQILQTGFDEKFISDTYNSELVMQKMSDKLSGINNRTQIFDTILSSIVDVIKLKDSSIIVSNSKGDEAQVSYTLFKDDKRIILQRHTPLIQYHQENFEIISFRKLPDNVKEHVLGLGFSKYTVCLPLYSPHNLLEGIIILGEKVSELSYDDKDMLFFNVVSNYAKAILDRMRPYEKIQKEFQESQKRFFDAEIMRIQSKKNEDFAFTLKEYNHEIRTPLAIIRSRAQDLPESTANEQEFKQAILKNVERANDIVGTTLRLTADDIKEKKENKTPQLINKIISDVIDYKFHKQEIDIVIDFTNEDMLVNGVKSELEHVFLNILQNANEAMPDGGKIIIRGFIQEDNAIVSIQDNGIGISEQELPKVFEIHRSRHVTKGRGLGLSFVHKLIMEHDGTVSITSKESVGTEVVIKLPLHKLN